MQTVRKVTFLILLFLVMPAVLLPAPARGASAVVTARANVMPWATLRAERIVHEYVVDQEDLSRGFVIIRDAATVTITTNSARDVSIRPMASDVGRISLAGPDGRYDGVLHLATAPESPVRQVVRTIDYRIDLPAGARPGRYALNATLDVASY